MDVLNQYECINISEVCRICLIKKDEMITIRESGIEDIIIYYTSIQILEEDRSHFMCIDCISKVQNWFDFYQQIVNSFKIGHLVIKEIENQKREGIDCNDRNICFLDDTKDNLEQEKDSIHIFPKNVTKCARKLNDEKEQLSYGEDSENIDLKQDSYQNEQLHNAPNIKSQNKETSKEFLTNNRNYECEKCGKKFRQIQSLNDHIKRHYNLRNFACSLCGKTFYKQFNVLEHMRIHTGERPFSCEFCDKTFTRTLLLRNHIKKVHTNDTKFICEVCKKPFVDNYQLKVHMRIHTGEKPYECSECEKTFAVKGQLNSHIKYKHTKQKDFICNICARAFTAKHSLEEHLRVHSGKRREPKHECSLCGKKCITTTQLKIHIQSQHTGERPFPCQICIKGFTTKSALDCHLRTHTGEKSYFCGECGKAFTTNSSLRIHLRVHTGERPYKCTHCCKTFSQASTLNTHMKIHK